ncbi:MAG: mechanosensitive ion channel domain-containing protein [Alphaproteobacteria bacterium]
MTKDAEIAIQSVIELITTYALDVVGALVLLIVGWMIAGWVGRTTRRAITATPRSDSTLAPFLANIVRYLILALVLIAVLAQFGVQTASIIAVLGTAGLAVGLALQGTLSHFAAGVVLLILRPFRAEDYIDSGAQSGTVVEIGLFATILRTADGVFLYLPNGQLMNAAIKNFSRNPTRRIDITVGIGYDDEIDKAFATARGLLDGDDRVLKDPAAEVRVSSLGDSAVNINLRCWVKAADYWNVLNDFNKGIKERLDAAGISIPFPQRDVHITGRAGVDSA